jgi:hypothetical protein
MSGFEALYASAVEDLVRGRADLARPKLAAMWREMPGHPQLVQLAENLAVVEFPWPAERKPYAPAPRDPPAQENIDVVLFHADLERAPSGVHEEGIDYKAVLAQSFESARLRAPRARRILLTDEKTAVAAAIPVDGVLRFAIDTSRLMFERMRVQELYLRGRGAARASFLMDSDVVVNADPARVFSETFDVGLTWRPKLPDSPFNGGLIMAAEGDGARRFLQKTLACYETIAAGSPIAKMKPRDLRVWWGDQLAIAIVVGLRAFAERGDAVAGEVDGIRVRYFPGSDYNFVMEPGVTYAREELRRKFFIHFKGNRKAMQSAYLAEMAAGKV